MGYLTYDEYGLIGGQLSEAAFRKSMCRVSAIIDNATHGRLQKMQEIPLQVKELCRDLTDYLVSTSATTTNITGKSQSSGGVSESESYSVKTAEQQQTDIDHMILDYLMSVKDDNGTPLLYRGAAI